MGSPVAITQPRRGRVNVLFTSAGRRVELLRAFRRAYSILGLEGHLVGVDVDPLAPALQIVHKSYIVPPVKADNYIAALTDICLREQIDLILPLIDPDIPALSAARLTLEATGARVGIVSPEAVAITADKWRTFEFFQSIGLPTPRSWLPAQMPQADFTYPLFIKPRSGSAAKDAFRVDTQRELEFFLEYVPDPIIQECILGAEITSDVLCNWQGTLRGVVSRRRIDVRAGEVAKGVTVHDQAVIDACARIARELPAAGPITVQCLMAGEVPCFTEINARLGGGIPLSIAAGCDVPVLILSDCAGIPCQTSPVGVYETGLYMTRFDDSFVLTESKRQQIAEGCGADSDSDGDPRDEPWTAKV